MKDLFDEWRCACRKLVRTPGLSIAVIAVIAIAIAANTAVYTLADNFYSPALAGKHAKEVYIVGAKPADPKMDYFYMFPENFLDTFETSLQSFQSFSRVQEYGANLSQIARPIRLEALRVGAGFTDLIGVEPVLGRGFIYSDFEVGADKSTMITVNTWKNTFEQDPGIIDRSIFINGIAHRVVGVLPESFSFEHMHFGLISASSFKEANFLGTYYPYLWIIGRLKEGITFREASNELAVVDTQLAEIAPPGYFEESVHILKRLNRRAHTRTKVQLTILISVGTVILLITAFNVASIAMVRINQRAPENATRMALGAKHWHLFRFSALEFGTLIVIAFLLGLLLGHGIIQLVLTRFNGDARDLLALLEDERLSLNFKVIAYSALACVVVWLLVSVTTLIVAPSKRIAAFVKQSSRSSTGSMGFNGSIYSLLFLEIACTTGLLVLGGFFVSSLNSIKDYDYGYSIKNISAIEYNLPYFRFDEASRDQELFVMSKRLLQSLKEMPGVQEVAITDLELPHEGMKRSFRLRSTPAEMSFDALPQAWYGAVSPGLLEMIELKGLVGSFFNDKDNLLEAENTVIINKAFANRHFPNEDPLGQMVEAYTWTGAKSFRIAGIANDIRRWREGSPTEPSMYFPQSKMDEMRRGYLYVKSVVSPAQLENDIRKKALEIDSDIALGSMVKLERKVLQREETLSVTAFAMVVVGGMGFLLSCIGTYSAVSNLLSQRRREMGIRIALGARPWSVGSIVLLRAVVLTVSAVMAGLSAAYFAMVKLSLLEGQLYLVDPRSPYVYFYSAIALVLAGVLASIRPAVDAASVNPNDLLKEV